MLQLGLTPSRSDELEAKPSSYFSRSMSDDSQPYISPFAPTPLEHPQLDRMSGSLTDSTPNRAPSHYSSSPPSSLSPVMLASAVDSTDVSDAEDDNFPLTPQSKQSHNACHVASPSTGVRSPTPNRSSKVDDTNTFSLYPMITSFEEQHHFDRFLGRPVNDPHSLETISQQVQDIYCSHIGRLSVKSVCCAVHYKEAAREQKRMRWYTARWEAAEAAKAAHPPSLLV
ncbi:hypothetical protein F4604DRAFT_1927753 [Suillus subluteus]|nr:hypothetical protein F4604DRAFT_1927753 [Suillus subluteus]